jgi:hypothetical protein
VLPIWAIMRRSPTRLTDRKPHPSPERLAAARAEKTAQLTKVELELGDGRYLLAYGRPSTAADA